jgi:hypothetical protein
VETLKTILAVVFPVVVASILVGAALIVMSSNTGLSISPTVTFVGMTTPVTVHLTNPHGVRRVSAFLDNACWPRVSFGHRSLRRICSGRGGADI